MERNAGKAVSDNLKNAGGGNVSLLLALLLPVLLAVVGAAVDASFWWRARTLTRTAIDAAVLRGARELQTNQTDWNAAVRAAQQLYREGVARLPLRDDTVSFEVVDGGAGLVARGSAAVATPILSLISIAVIPVLSLTGADDAKGVVTIGSHARQNLELAIVVDLTAAVAASLDGLKVALKQLIDDVVWPTGGYFVSRAALIPYTAGVSPGALMVAVAPALTGLAYFDMASGSRARLAPSDCVGERVGGQAFTDAPPVGADVLPRIYNAAGRCPIGSSVLPLTADASTLKAGVDGFAASRGVAGAGHVGAAWGWYLVSPRWAGSVVAGAEPMPGAGLSIPPGTAGSLSKIVVLVGAAPLATQFCNSSVAPALGNAAVPDRDSSVSFSAAGACLSPNGSSELQLGAICTGMRAAGVRIFGISLAAAGSENPNNALRACASSADSYYDAPAGIGIDLAVRDIALKITTIYLSQ